MSLDAVGQLGSGARPTSEHDAADEKYCPCVGREHALSFAVNSGEHAVVIEDVITTGGSSKEVVEILRREGAHVSAVASIIDRSGGKADLGVPRVALAVLEVVAFPPGKCPLCQEGSPVVKPGSRPGA